MYKKGLRCRICTGCGLCPGVTPGMSQTAGGEKEGGAMRVLSDSAFTENTASAVCGNKRLVTADLGTTTIAMLLYGPDGAVEDRYLTVNPQAVYGADVISRIRAAEDREQAEDMRGMVLRVLEQGLERFRKRLSGRESMRLVLAANTTMTYLLMGWDTSELGRAPFRASRLNGGEFEIAGVPCFVFPGVSAFIGGDITAGMYACSMSEGEEIMLLIDLGTNGEIVLGNRKRRIACATAAGPAFEGGANKGIWGADMISRIAALRREGLLDETGLLAESCFESGVKVGNIHVTQESVRAVQLAKGAIAAGIEILLGKYGIREEQVERVVLAGGFGYYLNPGDAALIGAGKEGHSRRKYGAFRGFEGRGQTDSRSYAKEKGRNNGSQRREDAAWRACFGNGAAGRGTSEAAFGNGAAGCGASEADFRHGGAEFGRGSGFQPPLHTGHEAGTE